MSFSTYWLITPLIGTACMMAIWLWLHLTRPRKPRPGE
jgi:hypothetical protein